MSSVSVNDSIYTNDITYTSDIIYWLIKAFDGVNMMWTKTIKKTPEYLTMYSRHF